MNNVDNKTQNDELKGKFTSGNPKLMDYINEKNNEKSASFSAAAVPVIVLENFYDNALLKEIQRKVIQEIRSEAIQGLSEQGEIFRYIEVIVNDICKKSYSTLPNRERLMVIQSLVDEFTGLGPLKKLILDDSVSEIMVNGWDKIYIEKSGRIMLTDVKFRDNEHVLQIIDKIVSPIGRRIDESSPMVDARLPDGSRVNIIIPPLSLIGPVITIRKFFNGSLTINKLVSYNSLNDSMAKFLQCAVEAKTNVIVAGGTGSGKTTLLNVLSSFIPENERIVTIEDAAELKLMQPHIISLEARPANTEGKGEITIRDLVRNSLRMRPDRIVIGEVRGAEALDMLQAMNTGHNGSLSTLHANSPRDALSRLETMALYSGIDFPLKAIRDQVCSAIDLIVYIERFPDGGRKITNITEVLGMESETILLQNIFTFDKLGKINGKVRGEFKRSSVRPRILDKIEASGITNHGW